MPAWVRYSLLVAVVLMAVLIGWLVKAPAVLAPSGDVVEIAFEPPLDSPPLLRYVEFAFPPFPPTAGSKHPFQTYFKMMDICQGRSKIRPPWRRKTRPFGSWVEWRNAAVRRGRQDAGVAAGWRAFLLCSRRELSPFSSRMWTWWVSRSSSAPVSRSDPKISVHSLKGRFEVTSVDACS